MSTPTTTAVNPQLLNNFPPAIAAALATLSSQVLADLTTLMGGSAAGSSQYKARAVVTSLSGAYGGSGTGVLTASAAAAFGTQDGVSTLAQGDVVFLPPALTNESANADAGPYVITTLGSGTVKWVLTRPTWWATNAVAQPGQGIDIGGEGTHWGGNTWKVFGAEGSTIVDTNDLVWYPRKDFATTGAAVSGVTPATGAATQMYVAPTANIIPVLNTNATAAGIWKISTQTPGYPGTSVVRATSTAGTETSTVNLFVVNF